MPGIARALRYSEISLLWSVPRFEQMVGYTHDRRRHDSSIVFSLHASRYILAVGPPRSVMVPAKFLVVSRISSISRRIDGSERLWMMRPSCSVIEQKVQPPKQPRMMLTE
jgi:hypothetical protein